MMNADYSHICVHLRCYPRSSAVTKILPAGWFHRYGESPIMRAYSNIFHNPSPLRGEGRVRGEMSRHGIPLPPPPRGGGGGGGGGAPKCRVMAYLSPSPRPLPQGRGV